MAAARIRKEGEPADLQRKGNSCYTPIPGTNEYMDVIGTKDGFDFDINNTGRISVSSGETVVINSEMSIDAITEKEYEEEVKKIYESEKASSTKKADFASLLSGHKT